jgi:flagellar biosynthesis/type III secretory pathway M-ring protein FliF/YscJ
MPLGAAIAVAAAVAAVVWLVMSRRRERSRGPAAPALHATEPQQLAAGQRTAPVPAKASNDAALRKEALVKELGEAAKKDPIATARVLRTWIHTEN